MAQEFVSRGRAHAGTPLVTRRRKSRDDDQGPSAGEASGTRDGDSVLDHLRRVRPSVYGEPTAEMRQRDLDRVPHRPR